LDGKDDGLKYSLDEDQRLAVIKDDKYNLVIAGAGSGKTPLIPFMIGKSYHKLSVAVNTPMLATNVGIYNIID